MTQAINPVRWGVLGAARIARSKVIPALQASPWCQLQAVGARDPAVAREVSAAFGFSAAYGSYDEVLDDPQVEAVYIPLPNHLHVEMALKAARQGKHVLCEKPIALSAEQAALLREAPAGIRISEALMVRHQLRWKALRAQLAAGAHGLPRALHSTLSFPLSDPADFRHQAACGGGALLDMGCYTAMAARYVFGREPLRVLATADMSESTGVDRTVSAMLDFGRGCHAVFTVSTDMALSQTLHVVCERGTVTLPAPYAPANGRPATMVWDTSRDHDHPEVAVQVFDEGDQFEHEVTAFSRAVRGHEADGFGLDDAVANMRVLDAVRASAHSGTWVPL